MAVIDKNFGAMLVAGLLSLSTEALPIGQKDGKERSGRRLKNLVAGITIKILAEQRQGPIINLIETSISISYCFSLDFFFAPVLDSKDL